MKRSQARSCSKNDTVVVIAGKDRGRQGRILRVLPGASRVIVERVNMIKRHTRPNPAKNIAGGISEREAAIHISNVMLVDPDRNVPTRIGAPPGRRRQPGARRQEERRGPGVTRRTRNGNGRRNGSETERTSTRRKSPRR